MFNSRPREDTATPSRPVVWLAVDPAPYNWEFYKGLRQHFGSSFSLYFDATERGLVPWLARIDEYEWVRRLTPSTACRLVANLRRSPDVFVISCGWSGPIRKCILLILSLERREFAIWTDTPANGSSTRHRVRNVALRPILGAARAILGTGNLALRVLQEMGVDEAKLVNLPYPVVLPKSSSLRSDKGEACRFLCAGRLVSYKGFDRAIRALALLPEDVGLDVIGTGPERRSLEELASGLRLKDRVNFMGAVANEVLLEHLTTRIGCLVHPARSLEPYGVVVVEAMARGVPVIGTEACGAIVDRVVHGVNGEILPTLCSTEQLATAMGRLAKDVGYREELGRCARATAEEWPVERYIKVVEDVVVG